MLELFSQTALKIQAGSAVENVLQDALNQLQPLWRADGITLYRGEQVFVSTGAGVESEPLPPAWQAQKVQQASGATWYWPVLVQQKGWGWLMIHWTTDNLSPECESEIELIAAQIGLLIQASQCVNNEPFPIPILKDEPYHFLLNYLPVGVCLSDPQTNCIYANKKLSELWQMPVEELLGHGWQKAVHPDDLPRLFQLQQQLLANPTDIQVEYRIQRADGSILNMHSTVKVLQSQTGEVVGFLATHRDITQEKLLETMLCDSEKRYRQIVDYQTDFLIYSLPDTTITFGNSAIYQALGYAWETAEMVGMTWRDIVVDARDWKNLVEQVEQLTPQQPLFRYTHPICGKQGQIVWVEWLNLGIFDEDDRLMGMQSLGRDVTLLRQAEQALQESRQEFATLLQNTPGMVYRYHPATSEHPMYFSYVSDYAEEIFELTPAEIMADSENIWLSFIVPEDLPKLLNSVQDAVARSAPWHCQWRIITPSGKLKWLEGRSQMRQRENKQFWDGIIFDITELKETQQELEASRTFLQQILHNLPLVVWRYQLWPDGREAFKYVSPTCAELFGVNAEAAMSDPQLLWNLVPPEDIPPLQQAAQISQANLTLWQCEFRITTPQGQTKWLRGTGQPRRQPDGSTVWDSVFQDITAQKEAELRLQKFNQQLESRIQERTIQLQQQAQEEGLLRLIIEAIHESVDIAKTLPVVLTETRQTLSCDRVVVYQFNPDWSGYFLAESVGDGWVPVVNSPLTTLSDHCLQETQGGRFQQHYILVSNDIYQSGFTDCHIQLLESFQARAFLVVPIFLERDLWGLLAAYQNSDARVWQTNEINMLQHVGLHLAIALRQSELYKAAQAQVVELQKLNRMKDEFLSTVSHELRSPMHNIGLALKMLELRLKKAGVLERPELQIGQYLNILKTSTQRETDLINDLLDLARLNVETRNIPLESVNVQAVLDKILPPIRERIQNQKQQFIFVPPKQDCYLASHPHFLERILQELLHNACKYTPAHETITLAVEPSDEDHCTFRVINTGVTIPPEEQKRVFDNFYRIANHDPWQYGGTGLGLALVKKMTEQLHGQIELLSEDNQTEFRVHIPRHKEAHLG